ncbi:MAG TPA: serine hydrolase domain-containing protein, partial [Terriglobales bacterium]|nr:serine hydrolase domain-containing protein [Terriglobales bacterium]
AYGFSDLDAKLRVEPNQLFEIGSITKSFLAILLLQLRDEGKIDLHQPISESMPWLRIESQFAPITLHHLLTHTSGLPSGPVFPSDPAVKYRAVHAPGEHFHYNNMGFAAMGHVAESKYHATFPEIVRERIFKPLAMNETEGAISFDIRDRLVKNYWAYMADRPYLRYGQLSEAPQLVMSRASGCIAATAHDMGLYMQMLANGGKAVNDRLLSEQSFTDFATPHVKAEDFGPTASYGYGIAVDTLNGHKILRHTGGMVSFASAMQVDADAGIGAFASINAMQGYRPNAVAQYAIQLMRAVREGKPLPDSPEIPDPTQVKDPERYSGSYRGAHETLEFVHQNKKLLLVTGSQRIRLEAAGQDRFLAPSGPFRKFLFVFGRADETDSQSPFVEVGYGPDLYTNSKYNVSTAITPQASPPYVGHYHSESPWNGSVRIVMRKGKLMIDGVVPLEAGPNGIFYLRDEPHSPEWIQFFDVVDGRAMRLRLSGEDFWRVAVD